MGILDGKVAVVTGAGRGIGRGHARLLAEHGARVVVNDADAGPAGDVVDEIVAAGGQAVANTDNVATWNGGGALVQHAIDTFGRLDILVNNAGILRDAMSFNITEELWDAVIDVHLKGHMSTCHAAAKHWQKRTLQERRGGARPHRQHRERVGALRPGRSDQLRDGEGGHRLDDDRARARDEEVRRHRQRRVPAPSRG